MSDANQKEKGQNERRFSQDQYDMLKRCSEKKDMTEWNEWRMNHFDRDILLEGADLSYSHLEGCFLHGAYLTRANLNCVHLDEADLSRAHLEDASVNCAYLKGTKLGFCHLENIDFSGSHLETASLEFADLKGANLCRAHLEGAKLYDTRLIKARLWGAYLQKASLIKAHLEGAEFIESNLQGANFRGATISGATLFSECKVDRRTNFDLVGLDSVRIHPGTKQLLEYNIRRMNWQDWYKEHWFWRWPVQLFWVLSDYGRSTLRVVGIFFMLAFFFAAVYANWAYWAPPGIVSDLIVKAQLGESMWHYGLRALARPVYFSIVTMTTLGFGDMYANKGSLAGHVILAVQVILGYVLLGALITRFAVLFTAGGPAGRFSKAEKT